MPDLPIRLAAPNLDSNCDTRPGNCIDCNVCVQREQMLAALSSLKDSEFCIRLRSDFVVEEPNYFMQSLALARNELGSEMITLLLEGGRDPLRMPQPFFLSDWLQMGTAKNLRDYFYGAPCLESFGPPSKRIWSRTFNFGRRFEVSPEQCFTINFVGKRLNLSTKISHEPSFANFKTFIGETGAYVCLIGLNSMGIRTSGMIKNRILNRVQISEGSLRTQTKWMITVKSFLAFMFGNFLFVFHPIWIGMRRPDFDVTT